MIETVYARDVPDLADPHVDVWSDSLESTPFHHPGHNGVGKDGQYGNHKREDHFEESAEISMEDLETNGTIGEKQHSANGRDKSAPGPAFHRELDAINTIAHSLQPLQSKVDALLSRVNRVETTPTAGGLGELETRPPPAAAEAPAGKAHASLPSTRAQPSTPSIHVETSATKGADSSLHSMMRVLADSSLEMKEVYSLREDGYAESGGVCGEGASGERGKEGREEKKTNEHRRTHSEHHCSHTDAEPTHKACHEPAR